MGDMMFYRRDICLALKGGKLMPRLEILFSYDSLNASKSRGINFPANVLYNSMGRPSGPGAFPLLKPFIASDNSSIEVRFSFFH